MPNREINRLAAAGSWPAVTITLDTSRIGAENDRARIVLRGLVEDVTGRLTEELGQRGASDLIEGIESQVAGIDWERTEEGLAIYVSEDVAETHPLPYSPDDLATIDGSFRLRELVDATRYPRVWVVVLSEQPAKLFKGDVQGLAEVRAHGFPFTFPGEAGRQDRDAGSAQRDARYERYFRDVAAGLRAALTEDDLPVILVGIERYLAFFAKATGDADEIVGAATGSYDWASANVIAERVAPAIEAYLQRAETDAKAKLEAAIGGNRVARGLEDAWTAAWQGRGELLVIERGLQVSAVVSDDGQAIRSPEDGADDDESLRDDVASDLVEQVLALGGEVVFVDDLSSYDGAALTLRW